MSLTPKMLRGLKAIDRLTTRGVAPSYEELAAELGLSSKPQVYNLLVRLRERGYITTQYYRARSLEITRLGRGALISRIDLSGLTDAKLTELARDVQAEIRRRTPRAVA